MHQIKIDSTDGSEIVTLTEAKEYARIDTSADDDLITSMIVSARQALETYLSRDIVAKTRSYWFPSSIDGCINLPFPPIASITSVISNAIALPYTAYGFDDKYIQLSSYPAKNIEIVFVTSGMTNDDLKTAIKMLVSTYYDNREDFVSGTVSLLPIDARQRVSGLKYMFI